MESNQGYAAEAPALIQRYEALSFEQVHADLLHLYPAAPCRVLDVGAGTGRDAAALSSAGYVVWAVEPTLQLREAGRRIHAASSVIWIDDALPELATLRAQGLTFELILLTAVWMHLDADQRTQGMSALRALASPGARVAMTLRHGPVPAGRRMFEVSGAETTALAKASGFTPIHETARSDVQSRPDVTWTCLVLEAP